MADSFENRLIDFLIKIDSMSQKANRDVLLISLPSHPVSSINRPDSTLNDLTNIVQAANRWGRLNSGEFPLKVVMNNTRKFVKGLELENKLNELIKEFDSELKLEQDEIEIPFVIVAMTKDEARKLSKTIKSNIPDNLNDELRIFKQITQVIKEHGVEDFISHYSVSREEWKPYFCPEYTIESIVTNIIEYINSSRQANNKLPLIKPKFLSTDCFGLDDDTRDQTWKELRQSGCVLIVDAISLFCSTVRDQFRDGEVSSNEKVAILVVSPINQSAIHANQLFEQTIKSRMPSAAFSRFNKDLDKLCEIGIGDLRAIKRWFFSVLPETVEILTKQKPNVKNTSDFREKMGQRNGVDKLIYGSSL